MIYLPANVIAKVTFEKADGQAKCSEGGCHSIRDLQEASPYPFELDKMGRGGHRGDRRIKISCAVTAKTYQRPYEAGGQAGPPT